MCIMVIVHQMFIMGLYFCLFKGTYYQYKASQPEFSTNTKPVNLILLGLCAFL